MDTFLRYLGSKFANFKNHANELHAMCTKHFMAFRAHCIHLQSCQYLVTYVKKCAVEWGWSILWLFRPVFRVFCAVPCLKANISDMQWTRRIIFLKSSYLLSPQLRNVEKPAIFPDPRVQGPRKIRKKRDISKMKAAFCGLCGKNFRGNDTSLAPFLRGDFCLARG